MALNTKAMTAGAAFILIMATGVPAIVHAQDTYEGYCYSKKESNKTTGTVVGALAGGVVGSQVSKNERGLGAVVGAVAGGALGRAIGSSSTKCLNGEYYSYQNGAYNPGQAPDGYDVTYFKTRPSTSTYSVVYYDAYRNTNPNPGYAQNGNYNNGYNNNNNGYNNGNNNGNYANQPPAIQGWRDDKGTWHEGQPVAFGWKDTSGRWHEGRLQAYGYKDSYGQWRESNAPAYGYNNQ